MIKKRLIFTLLYDDGNFFLSRNFRLQRVGDLEWLKRNYNFSSIATSIDELIIIDVSRHQRDYQKFCKSASIVSLNCFVPLALGGGISSLKEAEILMKNGADKLIVNTALVNNTALVRQLVTIYGSQCIIASVDYRMEDGNYTIYVDQGRHKIDTCLTSYLLYLKELKVGEIYLNSIDRDGTGQGYCMEVLNKLPLSYDLPLIMAGGAGNQHHLLDGLSSGQIDAAATANLFNFVGNSLPTARKFLLEHEIPLASW